MSSLASQKSHGSSCGKMGKTLNTTPVPIGTKEGAFCTYLGNKTNRAYARLEVYAVADLRGGGLGGLNPPPPWAAK